VNPQSDPLHRTPGLDDAHLVDEPDPLDDTQPSIPIAFPLKRKTPPVWSAILALAAVIQVVLFVVAISALVVSLLQNSPQSTPITVIIDGEARATETSAETVNDLLRELAITLNEGDSLSPAPDSPITTGLTVRIRRARTVTLMVDGDTHSIRTLSESPQDIINSTGIQLGSHDLVFIDGTQADPAHLMTWPVPINDISITRAVSIQVNDDGAPVELTTTQTTIGEALFEAGITLYLGDVVTPDVNMPVSDGLAVTIERSRPVTIVADGVTVETRTQGETVGEALVEAGVPLVGLDYAIPGEETPVLPGISIRVIRVTEEVVAEQALIPFETVYQDDPTLELDQRAIIQEGQSGVQETHVRVRYENGVEIDRTAEETVLVREPVNRIVAYGTNIVVQTVETPEGPRQYWRKFRMYATSYHPAALGGDNITATGEILTKGIVGIDPTIIPYGTQLFVPGYGIGLAADTGGPRTSRYWIDLGYDDENYVGWSRYVDVYILAPVPDRINYLLPEWTPIRGQ
jgi:uncharacterized protein YabE (DUF348 family)